ncbi:MAG: polyprenyl synthetase family protein [Dermabacter sp.]|nr:polyprenyl synthetase family protein [Dermabacter sp.]
MSSFSLGPIDDDLSAALLRGLDSVEDKLVISVATSDAMVQWTARYLLDAGGKRARPALVFLAAAFGDMHRPEVVDGACLVELTHLATLYHDDVMDSAETRRGIKTAHEVWGNNAAILTGDFLFARASAMSAGLGPDIVKLHAHTFERLCLGQLNETVGPPEGADPFEHYLEVLSHKTGSLISAAGIIGATLGGASPEIVETLGRYGEAVGVAFQLADDVLDVRGTPDVSGKIPGTDLREGVPTMPTLLLRRRVASGDASAHSLETLAAIDGDLSSDEALAHAVSLLAADPAVDDTQALADRYADEALELVHSLPEGAARDALEAFTISLVHRSA